MAEHEVAGTTIDGGRRREEHDGGKRYLVGGAVVLMTVLIGLFPRLLFGSDQSRAKELVQQTCVQCHRLEGKPDSRFTLKAPDLICDLPPVVRPPLV